MKPFEFLFQSIPLLIQLYAEKYRNDDLASTMKELENDSNIPRIKTYDFIVVGGGTAGCVVAGRLSEHYNVLLLEAGGTPPPAAAVPYFSPQISKDPTINYFYKSIPQNVSLNNGGIIRASGGKMLGGSGSHNGMIHNRGSPYDYDNWANITGDSNWSYANVLKYFTKSENFVAKLFGRAGKEYYGTGGPISIDSNEVPILPLWFAAGSELGFPIEDPNGFQLESFVPYNIAVDAQGQRSSSYTGYIKPFEQTTKNLTVIRYANVSEILLNDKKEAYGVAYTRHSFPQIAYASKEVILSAGTLMSPLILMKSGIGPVDQLEAAGIPVKVPLETVGTGMSEHAAIILSSFRVNDSSLFLKLYQNDTEKIVEAYHRGEGLLTMLTGGPEAFHVSSRAMPGWPNYWVQFARSVSVNDGPTAFRLYVVLGRPRSRGSVRLNAELFQAGVRDDTQLAMIDFNLLSHPDDMEDLVEGIKSALRLAEETKAFQSLNTTYTGTPDPACTAFEFRSDDYWRCLIVRQVLGWTHMGGTCQMGPDSSSSVIDSKMRLRGVSGLRVIDASTMPVVTNVNINAPVIMIGEKGADDILKAWA